MKVFDRFSGRIVNLPEQVHSGRYQLQQKAKLNNNISLTSKDILFSDGGQSLHLDHFSGFFLDTFQDDATKTIAELRRRAITTIACKTRNSCSIDISPLLPSELADVSDLLNLEKILSFTLERGHLHEIARRPRMNLRYETRITQLSRAKKIANNALSVLAASSADWQKQTISGIIPKRILALFSNDDLLLYENKVFARLLDKLDRHLRKRILEVKQLHLQYEKALELHDATTLYYVLCKQLCTLWGDAIAQDQSLESMLDNSKTIFEKLENLLQKVSMLRECSLYREIPLNAQVAEQLRSTNILCHDQHYRHLRTLWLEHQKTKVNVDDRSESIFAQKKSAHQDYVEYIGLIIRRTFNNMAAVKRKAENSYIFAEEKLTLKLEHDCWHIYFNQQQLVFIPALESSDPLTQLHSEGEMRIPIYCNGEEVIERVEKYLDPDIIPSPLYINPMGFYGEEKIHALIDIWLWRPLFAGYGQPITKLPAPMITWLLDNHIAKITKNDAFFYKPLCSTTKKEFIEYLEIAQINNETRSLILQKIQHLNTLNTCRVCGESGVFSPKDSEKITASFQAKCSLCASEWMMLYESKKRKARYTLALNSNVELGFSNQGHWCIDIF